MNSNNFVFVFLDTFFSSSTLWLESIGSDPDPDPPGSRNFYWLEETFDAYYNIFWISLNFLFVLFKKPLICSWKHRKKGTKFCLQTHKKFINQARIWKFWSIGSESGFGSGSKKNLIGRVRVQQILISRVRVQKFLDPMGSTPVEQLP